MSACGADSGGAQAPGIPVSAPTTGNDTSSASSGSAAVNKSAGGPVDGPPGPNGPTVTIGTDFTVSPATIEFGRVQTGDPLPGPNRTIVIQPTSSRASPFGVTTTVSDSGRYTVANGCRSATKACPINVLLGLPGQVPVPNPEPTPTHYEETLNDTLTITIDGTSIAIPITGIIVR